MYALAYSSVAGASLTRTIVQSASISSAAIIASAVCDPWPISQCGTRTVTTLSGVTVIHVLSSPRAAAPSDTTPSRFGASATPATPSTKPPTTPPAPMKARRVHLSMAAPLLLGDGVDGTPHPDEGAAAADVGDARVDLVVRRARVLRQQPANRHDHPGLTVPALWNLLIDPG